MREKVDLDDLTGELLSVVHKASHPSNVSLAAELSQVNFGHVTDAYAYPFA